VFLAAAPIGLIGVLMACTPEQPRADEPLHYRAPLAASPPRIDGRLDDAAWTLAPWTTDFVDIEGAGRPPPLLRTRARILWDRRYLYVAAELEEPHVWATLMERDAVIFHDDDFEVFLDPDPTRPGYYELEVNALGTVWDLRLTRPYREGGRAIDRWDIGGLLHAVGVRGTRNDPSDTDRGWSVELALPWAAFEEAGGKAPRPGSTWRINFSRVDWELDVVDGDYTKRRAATGELLPEHNWVWSPQGEINMHVPERWGFVMFEGAEP
jgi:hypothetical protein